MMEKQKVLELIEQAARDGWTELDLSNRQLASVPPEIIELTSLTTLNLGINDLTSVPPEIMKLTN